MDKDQQAELREAFRAVGDEFVKAFEQADRMARAAFDDMRKLVGDPPARRPGQESDDEPGGGEPIDAIRKLAALRDDGLITDEEFAAKKAELLGRI
jgi:hypothetical protein